MLGSGDAISSSVSKSNNSRKQRIGIPGNIESSVSNNKNSEFDKMIKEAARKNMIKGLIERYYNKIYSCILNAIANKQKEVKFYYNYYDFVNKKNGSSTLNCK